MLQKYYAIKCRNWINGVKNKLSLKFLKGTNKNLEDSDSDVMELYLEEDL